VRKILASKWTKVVLFCLCLLPIALLVCRGFQNDLTANPSQFLEHRTGDWTLRFVVITLSITPLRKILRLSELIRFRRMVGLFAFFYGSMHFTAWIWFDKFFDWSGMWADVHKRPYITVGFTGFLLMIPLAITSTAGWIRRLGGKRWRRLHRAIYITAVAGIIHYYWLVKSDVRKPIEYGLLVALLLAWRVGSWVISRRKQVLASGAGSAEPTTAESA
jgi:methionine sulfoxide reductase heme-binding subunit